MDVCCRSIVVAGVRETDELRERSELRFRPAVTSPSDYRFAGARSSASGMKWVQIQPRPFFHTVQLASLALWPA